MDKKQNKKIIIGLVILVAVIAALVIGYQFLKPQPMKGDKTVQVTVVSEDQTEKEYNVQTDAEYLQQVMDEAEGLTYTGTEGDYGLMVEKVNDEIASYDENNAYWGFYVNDEYCNYSISEQPVADGDEFKIVFTSGE
ncbi:MAG: DUF4430 domain-containing protein [Lachnospiraceae bacterium]